MAMWALYRNASRTFSLLDDEALQTRAAVSNPAAHPLSKVAPKPPHMPSL